MLKLYIARDRAGRKLLICAEPAQAEALLSLSGGWELAVVGVATPNVPPGIVGEFSAVSEMHEFNIFKRKDGR
jgi:hypothetical protein